MLLQALGILQRVGLERFKPGSVDHLHHVAEALKVAFLEREAQYGDPNFGGTPIEDLLGETRLDRLFERIRPDAVMEEPPRGDARPARPRFDTTCLCAVDAAGNAFSATPSDTLDGRPTVPGLGFFVSPRGVQSRLDPDHPAVIAPGMRPRITPAPAVHRDHEQVLAFGCPGGDVIAQAMLQAFVNLVTYRMLPQQAVEAARVATFSFPVSFFPNPHFHKRLNVEDRVPPAIRAGLAAKGHAVVDWPGFEFDAGGVAMAGRLDLGGEDGPALTAAADPRRTCYAAGR